MYKKTIIRSNSYFDSVTLMRFSSQLSILPGIENILVGMGTDLNKELLQKNDLLSAEGVGATPNDLIIGINAKTEEDFNNALKELEGLFNKKNVSSNNEKIYTSVKEVVSEDPSYNMACISVPGSFAANECKIALNNNLNVFLFSDNVSIEEEIEIKDLALSKDLLLMGPDCGTAIINGVPLGFANVVRRGNIGIVGASGTGLQHLTTLIEHFGGGVSQAIGTGGRDLSDKVAGRTFIKAMEMLEKDKNTEIIVLLSKPPHQSVADKILEKAKRIDKKIITCLFGADEIKNKGNIVQCYDIEETAIEAVSSALNKKIDFIEDNSQNFMIDEFKKIKTSEQKYVRGIFGGGTLCDEVMITFRRLGVSIHSNIPLSEQEKLIDVHKSVGNTFIDMGDDYFTQGKPHPMIEPSLRTDRIVIDATDKNTAVIFLDIVCGFGSHEDPASVAIEAYKKSKTILDKEGRKILWVASLVATENDPQSYSSQKKKLVDAGFVVFNSNVRAAKAVASVINQNVEGSK